MLLGGGRPAIMTDGRPLRHLYLPLLLPALEPRLPRRPVQLERRLPLLYGRREKLEHNPDERLHDHVRLQLRSQLLPEGKSQQLAGSRGGLA